MARARSSLGFFGVFGRSSDLRQLDQALRAADLHPRLVPEAVKLTIVNLLKDEAGGEPPPQAHRWAAELVAYCMIGRDAFAQASGPAAASNVERRIQAALEIGDSLDAQLVLLTLHARIIQPSVVTTFGLSSESSPDEN